MQSDRWSWLRVGVLGGASVALMLVVMSCARTGEGRAAMSNPTTLPTTDEAAKSVVVTDQQAREMGFTFAVAPAVGARTKEQVTEQNAVCTHCHTTDQPTMHASSVTVSCVDCHGGNWQGISIPTEVNEHHPDYHKWKRRAHVQPKLKDFWKSAANPEVPGAMTNAESADYIRFVNPGDLRAARVACGNCHDSKDTGYIVRRVEKSMMAHGAMLWQAALYNNGDINRKYAVYGENYDSKGQPRALVQQPQPTTQQFDKQGILTQLWPLPRWEVSQPGNILRVFERGARFRPQLGVPERLEDSGKPDVKLSVRGFGTDVRTDPVFLGLQKTRLLDPTLSLFGTNDHPGDFRGSGCSACHVIYANDRSPVHSGKWANYGNRGESFSTDKAVNPSATSQPYANASDESRPARESGHPVAHRFEKTMPTSTCIVCHVHPGTNVVNAYLGFTWWDNETDGELMYPKKQKYPTAQQEATVNAHNPEGSAPRGLWSNLCPNAQSHAGLTAGKDFLENLWTRINDKLKHSQFADFHGHGWVFRAVFKRDAEGRLLDSGNKPVQEVTTQKLRDAVAYQSTDGKPPPEQMPVHLKDVHLEMGMHCADCHFEQDNHGDGNLYGETRNAVMIDCIDCHGTVDRPARMLTYLREKEKGDMEEEKLNEILKGVFSGNAKFSNVDRVKKFFDERFSMDDEKLVQKSADGKTQWTVKQACELENDAAKYAHWIRRDHKTFDAPVKKDEPESKSPPADLAHSNTSMSCYACHTSWNTSCFGCHLPMRANQAKPMLHNEGLLTRNYTNYNFQTLRDDVYMLGKDSSVKGGKVVPIRSACAVLVSSQDANRQWIYAQQQTVSAEGFAGTAFSPYFPHTVRAAETKKCSDCHVSSNNDNNATMAQLLLQGTNSVNFVGRFAWVAEGKHGFEAIAVTERDEPQAVIGSRLHELAYPDYFAQHVTRGRELTEVHEHTGTVLDAQLRGEYLYAACGPDGFIAFDVANTDNKGFSERTITAPVSPLGQRFYVKTKYATSVCSPSTMALDPTRPHLKENQEQPVHLLYAFLYVTDKHEGLVVIGNPLNEKRNKPGVATLLDGNPENNFLQRALAFNPDGALKGARHMALYGHYAYVSTESGLRVVNLDNPLAPNLLDTPGLASIKSPRKVAFQFRYGFVCDEDGLKVIDVTNPENPKVVSGASVPIADARDVYVCRTYGYVAAGAEGLVIVDLKQPEKPARFGSFTEGGMDDATAVRVAMTNSSLFAYVADGKHGLKVLQLTSADDAGFLGFSPKPNPRLIAVHKTAGHAISLSEGLDRDRAVDETGHQLAVFGRRGARPFNLEEMQRLFLRKRDNGSSEIYTVTDEPPK